MRHLITREHYDRQVLYYIQRQGLTLYLDNKVYERGEKGSLAIYHVGMASYHLLWHKSRTNYQTTLKAQMEHH